MLELRELLKIKKEHWDNLNKLQQAVNKLRLAYGKPLTVTSGYRSVDDHIRIYKEKGITDKSKIPMKSKHLSGLACDLVCDDLEDFKNFIIKNEKLCEELNLYFEHFDETPTWVHCQITPPASGKRFFYP